MDFKLLNSGRDSWNREEVQKRSVSNKLNKRIFVLVLLLVIIAGGVFLYRKNPDENKYIERIKSLLSGKLVSLKAMIAPELDLSEDLGLDLSEVNISAFVNDVASADKENLLTEGEEEEEEEEEIVITPKQPTLPEIKERVDEIAEKTEKIIQEVERLTALAELQKEVNIIAKKIQIISQQINELRTLAESQERVDSFAEETELSNQETT